TSPSMSPQPSCASCRRNAPHPVPPKLRRSRMSVYRVIDKLEASVKQGTVLPLGYRVVSEEKLLELIEKLRASLPEEVGRARSIAKNGDRLVREAQEKAQAIVTEASTQSTQLIDDHEIVRRAQSTAEVVLREAETKAARVR